MREVQEGNSQGTPQTANKRLSRNARGYNHPSSHYLSLFSTSLPPTALQFLNALDSRKYDVDEQHEADVFQLEQG